jgi:ATP-binding cassette subfamily B multidrug efflux pump
MSRSSLDSQDDPDARTYDFTDSQLLGRMVRYLLRNRLLFFLVCTFTALGIIFGILIPFVLRQAIDVDFETARLTQNIQPLMFTALLYVSLQVASWLLSYGSEYTMSVMGQQAIYEIRLELYKQLQVLSQDFYDKSSSGRVISRITNDIDRMSELMSGGLISAFAQIFIVVGIGIVIFTVDTSLAIVTLSVVPLLLVTTIYFRKKLREAYRKTRKTISNVTSNFAESISGAKVTKSFARESISIERFDQVNKADYDANVEAGKAMASFFPVIRFVGGLGVFLILLFGTGRIIGTTLTLGTLVMFMSFNDQFFRPILIIANFYTSVQSAFAGAERVFTVMDGEPTVKDAPGAFAMPEVQGHIVFKDVTFSYVENKPILENFNLEIQPGETIAVVGDTGAGKTTVVSLLNRFYDIQEGSIEIDGIDVRSVTQESLHERIGLVLQDPFLFMGTVRENIRYGNPMASDDDIVKATEAIGAKRLFEHLEDGLDTEVGERGSRLSEGERQLVSFARAILANPKILVLDEATSSIDVYTEHAIQKGMKALLQGRTSIVIAHRLSTIVNSDRILVIEHGKIVESGRHNELMKKKGKYYSLYELQIRPRAAKDAAEIIV